MRIPVPDSLTLEDEGTMILQNTGNRWPNNTASHTHKDLNPASLFHMERNITKHNKQNELGSASIIMSQNMPTCGDNRNIHE